MKTHGEHREGREEGGKEKGRRKRRGEDG